MRILVTGGAGYVGSVVVPAALAQGHSVRVVDFGMFGLGHVDRRAEVIPGDIIDCQSEWFEGMDAVIHLAGLSNDPMAGLSPGLNYLFNAAGAAIVAHAAKAAGVSRFILGSTCSVYGFSDSEEVDEDYPARPAFPYAVSKLMAERGVMCLGDEHFRPVILRKGTVVGWSPRMRFDLVTNTMVRTALTKGRIVVHNAHLWRPLIDVNDAAAAYVCAIECDPDVTGIFNIAQRNYSMGELAEEVALALEEFELRVPIVLDNRQDVRSYRVSTKRALDVLGFRAARPMRETVLDIMRGIAEEGITDFDSPQYNNVDQMKRILGTTVRVPKLALAA
jgi:nucleoside-diphosphate-sugar epimerase